MKLTKYLKKGMTVLLTATFCMGLSVGLTGCGKDTTKEDSKDIDTFRIMIAPYQDADTLLTGLEPLGGMIKDELATQGYNVGNVEITVGTSYSAVGEALSAGTADAGFLAELMLHMMMTVMFCLLHREKLLTRILLMPGTGMTERRKHLQIILQHIIVQ